MDTERRETARKPTNSPAVIRHVDGPAIASCVVCNMSDGGAKLVFETDVDLPREFLLFLGPVRTLGRRCQTIWRIGNKVGVRFSSAAGSRSDPFKGFATWAAE
jgi:hypothetical protein